LSLKIRESEKQGEFDLDLGLKEVEIQLFRVDKIIFLIKSLAV
jgi:hypothetical protein